MRLYLDPIGGVAGDMFAAAMLDAWPHLEEPLLAALHEAGLREIVRITVEPFSDGTLTGRRFLTAPAKQYAHKDPGQVSLPQSDQPRAHTHTGNEPILAETNKAHRREQEDRSGDDTHIGGHTHGEADAHSHVHAHRSYRTISQWLETTTLSQGVRANAQAMFRILAKAEGTVHGIPPEDVNFHEVGAWDSIADIVSAAWLIDAVGPVEWYSTPLPLGRGRVQTAHGELPLPAPATALILSGFPMHQDEIEGERITPTGAAILKHIAPCFEPMGSAGTLTGFGTGFGSKRFPGISNILRVTHFDDIPGVAVRTDTIAVCEFEIDDQTAEDLAEALDRIRSRDGVLDITQAPAFGKNGRLSAHVQILANVADLKDTLEAVLVQTATLGVRWRLASRAVLDRTHGTVHIDGETINVKQVTRPDGEITQKAEHRDIATYATSFGARKRLRIAAERALNGGKSFVE